MASPGLVWEVGTALLAGVNVSRNSHFGTALLACAIVGLVARLGAIGYLDLWHDELFSLDVAQTSLGEFRTFVTSGADYHPPLFYLLLQVVRVLSFEQAGELTLQLVNLGWFAVLVLALGGYGYYLPSERRSLLIAIAIVACSPVFVYLGAELRMYSMLLALTTLALICAHLAMATGHRRWFVCLGLCSLLSCLTHYAGFVITSAIFAAMLVVGRRVSADLFRGCLLAGAVLILGLVPCLGFLSKHLVREPAYVVSVWRSLYYLGLGVSLPLFLAGLVAIGQMGRNSSSAANAGHGTGLGHLALLAAMFFLGLVLLARAVVGVNLMNLGVSLVPACWLTLAICAWLGQQPRRSLRWLLPGMLVAQLCLAAYVVHDPTILSGNRMSTVTMYRRVLSEHPRWGERDAADLLVVHIDWPRDNAYFRRKTAGALEPDQLVLLSRGQARRVPATVRAHLAGGRREVLIVTRGRIVPEMLRGLETDFSIEHLQPGLALVRPVTDYE